MRPFEDLWAWQKGHALTIDIYRITRSWPREERFGLISQARRAAASVPANVAEGCGRRSYPQLRHSVDIATGSLSELEYWLLLARDLGYLDEDTCAEKHDQLNHVRRLLHGLAAWCIRQSEAAEQAAAAADAANLEVPASPASRPDHDLRAVTDRERLRS